MFFSGFKPFRWLAPGSNGIFTLALAFAAAVGMIHRIHCRAPDGGADAQPACAASLAPIGVHMILIAHRTDSGIAFFKHHAYFARGQFNGDIVPFLSGNDHSSPCGTGHLPPLAQGKLNIIYGKTQGDVFQWHGIAHLDG